jgi:hypothetical protein
VNHCRLEAACPQRVSLHGCNAHNNFSALPIYIGPYQNHLGCNSSDFVMKPAAHAMVE